jgi:hypothetical protein
MTHCHICNFRAIYHTLRIVSRVECEVTKAGTLAAVVHSTIVRMGEMEIDQRLRDLQREYLDFLDDEVLKLLYCSLYVDISEHLNTVTSTRKL